MTTNTNTQTPIVTVNQARAETGLGRATIVRAIAAGELPSARAGRHRNSPYMIPREALEEWLEGRARPEPVTAERAPILVSGRASVRYGNTAKVVTDRHLVMYLGDEEALWAIEEFGQGGGE